MPLPTAICKCMPILLYGLQRFFSPKFDVNSTYTQRSSVAAAVSGTPTACPDEGANFTIVYLLLCILVNKDFYYCPIRRTETPPQKPWDFCGFAPARTRGARHMSAVHVHRPMPLWATLSHSHRIGVSGPRLLWEWLDGRRLASRLAGHTQVGLAF